VTAPPHYWWNNPAVLECSLLGFAGLVALIGWFYDRRH